MLRGSCFPEDFGVTATPVATGHPVALDLQKPRRIAAHVSSHSRSFPPSSHRVHAPALNHIGLWVHPLPECVEWLTQQGMRFTPGGIRKGASGHDVAFIHPKGNADHPLSGEGVLIELVQAPPDICSHSKKS